MALYLDSADLNEARQAAALGFVAGATTNPTLVARSGRPAEEVVAALCHLLPGTIFHQVTVSPGSALEAEIDRFLRISDRVAFKIPCTLDYLAVVNVLSRQGLTCAVTGVFAPAQAYIAAEAGAHYVIPYVNRATRLCGDGPTLVAGMAAVLEGSTCQILAASIKTSAEAVDTLLAGAQNLTLPWSVLAGLAEHPLTRQAIDQFAREVS
jgi:transaldolase